MEQIKHALAERALERASQWLPIPVKNLPDPESLSEIALLGSYSFSLPQTRRRLIRKTIELMPGIEETPTAISRDYIQLVYKRGPAGTARQLEIDDHMPPVPNVARPQKFLHGVYVDIQSCYWSIMQIIGWNVDYYPGMWLSPGQPPKNFPFPDHKIARNCLVSAGRMDGIPRFDPRKLPGNPYDEIKPGNTIKNFQLPRLIHDILNCIATQCLDEGAIYANNDGVIAPTPGIAASCIGIIQDWGLTPIVKAEGTGEVKASGTYKIGTQKTLTYELRNSTRAVEMVFPLPYSKWLQHEFTFFVSKRKD